MTQQHDILLNALAASTAGACQASLFNPLDCLRIRWQAAVSQRAESCPRPLSSFTAQILREEGLWRGLHRPGLLMNILAVSSSQGLRMGMYPSVRDLVIEPGAVNPVLMALSGLLCGSIAYLLAAPVFLLKVISRKAPYSHTSQALR